MGGLRYVRYLLTCSISVITKEHRHALLDSTLSLLVNNLDFCRKVTESREKQALGQEATGVFLERCFDKPADTRLLSWINFTSQTPSPREKCKLHLFFGSGEFFPGVICLVTNHLLGASDTNEDNHGIMNTN